MRRVFAILVANPLSLLGLVLVAIVVFSAVFADFITPFPSHVGAVVDFVNFNQPPHWPYISAPTSSDATSSRASFTPIACLSFLAWSCWQSRRRSASRSA